MHSPARRRALPLCMPFLLLSLASTAEAQRHREPVPQLRRERPMLSLEATGLFSSVKGQALGTAGDGAGFDVMASVGSGMFALGAGYQRSTHTLVSQSSKRAIVDGAFIEPRLALPLATGNFTPYVFARAARLERSIENSGTEPRLRGSAIGGGVGTYFWLANNVQLNSALLWQDLRFDRAATSANVARADGAQWAIRAGLSVGFDNWGR
jgi:hypothetical protein